METVIQENPPEKDKCNMGSEIGSWNKRKKHLEENKWDLYLS